MLKVQLFYMNIADISVSSFPFVSRMRSERISSSVCENVKKQYLGVELLLNYYAAKNDLSVPVQYSYNDLGKPIMPDDSFHFSLAHSGDIAMCAAANEDVGLDVETKRLNRFSLSKKILSDSEFAEFEATDNKADYLIEKWTGKEAYLKLTGQGLRFPMKQISISGLRVLDNEKKPLAYVTQGRLSDNAAYAVASYSVHTIELTQVSVDDILKTISAFDSQYTKI